MTTEKTIMLSKSFNHTTAIEVLEKVIILRQKFFDDGKTERLDSVLFHKDDLKGLIEELKKIIEVKK